MWMFIVSALVVIVILILIIWSRNTPTYIVNDPQILVCAMGNGGDIELARADAEVYSRYYTNVDFVGEVNVDQLMSAVRAGKYDLVHLLANTMGSDLVGSSADKIAIADLISAGAQSGLKLLFLAASNHLGLEETEKLIEVCRDRPNIIVATRERGDQFFQFLNILLERFSSGKDPFWKIWIDLRPQDIGAPAPENDPGPTCLVELNRKGARHNLQMPGKAAT
jgi:hypothetical protein